jgi:hypothetical protein
VSSHALAGIAIQRGLGIEGVHLRRTAIRENVDDMPHTRREVRRFRSQRTGSGCVGGEQAGIAEDTGEAEHTHPDPRALQHLTPCHGGHWVVLEVIEGVFHPFCSP